MSSMSKKYIDLHCHPFKEYFENREEIIEDAKLSGVWKIFLVGTNLVNSKEAIDLAKNKEGVYPIIGIHPTECRDIETVEKLENMIDNSVVGIGEVGLDYHYQDSPSKEVQINCFKKHIEIAIEKKLPIIVHSRDAHEDTFQVIKEYKEKNQDLVFILHSYSSGPEYVEKYSKLGVYFSFSGIVTFKNAKEMQEAAKLVPLDLILCETDTPYLTPVPYRGKVNLPKYVIETTNFIAKLKEISIEEFLENINQNVLKCFSKIK